MDQRTSNDLGTSTLSQHSNAKIRTKDRAKIVTTQQQTNLTLRSSPRRINQMKRMSLILTLQRYLKQISKLQIKPSR